MLHSQLSWYARVYDGWNPEQANALRSRSHLWTMRIASVVMFVIVMAVAVLLVLQYP